MQETITLNQKEKKYKIAETYIKLDIDFNSENNAKLRKIIDSTVKKELIRFRESGEFEISNEIVYEIEFGKGSTKIRVIFFATIINGLIYYGSLRQGISQVYTDVKWLSENIIQSASQDDNLIDNNIIRTERRTGLTGRLKRNLDRIDYLENNLNNIGNNEVQAELATLRLDLANIIQLLELAERETFINNLSEETRNNLPEPNGQQVRHLENLYALKPEDE